MHLDIFYEQIPGFQNLVERCPKSFSKKGAERVLASNKKLSFQKII